MKLFNRTVTKNLLILFTLAFLPLMQSCENNPNNLGFILVPNVDTSGVRYLDSQSDSMNIGYSNYKKFVNTSTSFNMLAGYYQNYQSKALLKFTSISPDYDSVKVLSAILTLRNSGYYFKDLMGTTSFNLYRVTKNFNYSTVTFDSVNASDFGSLSLGSFTGILSDTGTINITLNNQIAKDWLEYAADTGYINKNYGIGLIPNLSSTSIKGFYSNNSSADQIPYTTIIFTKNDVEDTITLVTSEYVSLSDAPASIIPADRFLLQNGIAYRAMLNFDLSKLPGNVIINNATLLLYLDNAGSFISTGTDRRVVAGTVTDSVTKSDSIYVTSTLLDSSTYTINLTQIVQRWNSGIMPNLGITLRNVYELQNLDNFAFYPPGFSDNTKNPRLKITYTVLD